jgi:polar amino acid transport system substrate-binding protein
MGKCSFALALVGLMVGGVQLLFAPPFAYPACAADLKTIRSRGHLIVAIKDNLRPLSWRNEQGEFQGLEVDIARRLATEILGQPDAVKFVPVSNADRLQLVTDDKVDVAIAGITATSARRRLVHFSPAYYLNGTSFITTQPQLEKPSQLKSLKSVVALNGSFTIATLESALPNLKVVGVDSYAAAETQLAAGETFAANTSLLVGWTQAHPEYRLIPTQFNREPLAVAFPKGLQYEDLGLLVNRSLRQWQEDGWLQERATYWGLP